MKPTLEEMLALGQQAAVGLPFTSVAIARKEDGLKLVFINTGNEMCYFDVPPLAIGEYYGLPDVAGEVPFKLLTT